MPEKPSIYIFMNTVHYLICNIYVYFSGEGSMQSGHAQHDQDAQLQAMSKAVVVHQNTVRNMYFA